MAEINEVLCTTYTMTAAETTLNQNCVAVLNTAAEGYVKRAAGALATNIAGVLRDSSLAANETGSFQISGIAKVAISAAVAIGDVLVIGNAAGQVKPRTLTSGEGIVGRAISAGTTAGNIVKCILAIPNEYNS